MENYTEVEERVQSAYKRFFEVEKRNIAALGRDFQVPEGRLQARIDGRQSRSQRHPSNRLLTDSEELAVCLYLKRLDSIGTVARIPMVTGCANAILKRRCDDDVTVSGSVTTLADGPQKVGPTWTPRFLERHPEFHIRKQKTLDIARKRAHNPDNLREWFKRFKYVCDTHGIQATDIYNFDETGFRIGIGKDQWIITLDPDRQCYLASSSNRQLVTSCEVISGDGYVLPPMLILPGAIHLEDWVTKTGLDDDVFIGISESGYTNDILTLDWLHHFDRFSSQRQIGSYRLLVLDGYGSHCTKEFIDYCDEHRIIRFCLPPHATHLLQPLDVVVFQPLKFYHSEAIEEATRTGCSDFNKVEFLSAIGSIREHAFKRTTILSAFRKTGLIPYNPDIVLSKLRESSPEPLSYPVQIPFVEHDGDSTLPHSVSQPIAETNGEFTTPPPISSASASFLTTPRTVRSFKKHADFLWHTNPTSSDFRPSLNHFIKGSLAQGHLAAQLGTDLDHAEAAQLVRSNRQKRSRRVVQKGGVLYANEARSMIQKREENDLAKKMRQAELQLERLRKTQAAERKRTWKPIFKDFKTAVKVRNRRLKPRRKYI